MADRNFVFKVLLIGDAAVGKTALAHRYRTGVFMYDTKLTIGTDFYTQHLDVGERHVILQVWDFGGEDRFRLLLRAYSAGARGAIFVYDVTSPASLYHYNAWIEEVYAQAPGIPILAVGTKIDLTEMRRVSYAEGVQYTRTRGAVGCLEVSAKTGVNVDLVFEQAAMAMLPHNQVVTKNPQ